MSWIHETLFITASSTIWNYVTPFRMRSCYMYNVVARLHFWGFKRVHVYRFCLESRCSFVGLTTTWSHCQWCSWVTVMCLERDVSWTSEAIPCSSGGSSYLSWANGECGWRIQTTIESVILIISFLHCSALGVSYTCGNQKPQRPGDAARVSLLQRETDRMVSCKSSNSN